MKIGRAIYPDQSVWETHKSSFNSFINFGTLLYIGRSDQNLYLSNRENHDNIFNINYKQSVCLPIKEIEVFNVVNK